jgi:hypothetical protein
MQSPARGTSLDEEQFLCNEALRTGDFDAISDSEWVAMCEHAANKGRLAKKNSD